MQAVGACASTLAQRLACSCFEEGALFARLWNLQTSLMDAELFAAQGDATRWCRQALLLEEKVRPNPAYSIPQSSNPLLCLPALPKPSPLFLPPICFTPLPSLLPSCAPLRSSGWSLTLSGSARPPPSWPPSRPPWHRSRRRWCWPAASGTRCSGRTTRSSCSTGEEEGGGREGSGGVGAVSR
jgi:hypothetical protein